MFNKAYMVANGSVAPSGHIPRKINKVSLLVQAFEHEDLTLIPDNLDQLLALDDGASTETRGAEELQSENEQGKTEELQSENEQGKTFDMRKLKDEMIVRREVADTELEGKAKKKFDMRQLKDSMKTTPIKENAKSSGDQEENKQKNIKLLSTINEEPEIIYLFKKQANFSSRSSDQSRIVSIHPPQDGEQVDFKFLPLPPTPESAIKPPMINVHPDWFLDRRLSGDDPSEIYDDVYGGTGG